MHARACACLLHLQATLESVYKEQEGSLENMLWGGKETEDTVNFLESCIKKDAAPNPYDSNP